MAEFWNPAPYRLLAQCELHRDEAMQLMDPVQIAHGNRVLDVGYGPLGCSTFSAHAGGVRVGDVTGRGRKTRG